MVMVIVQERKSTEDRIRQCIPNQQLMYLTATIYFVQPTRKREGVSVETAQKETGR